MISQIITNTGPVGGQTDTAKSDVQMKNEEADDEGGEDDLDDDQIECLEFIIEYLLEALKDDDNIVRWTAAKGIGRITMRLSKDFAD